LMIDTGIKAFNTLGSELQPIMREAGKPLRCYTCGPTVYSTSHLGHARTYIALDMIRRIMTDYFNIPVQWAMNVTDVDDKIIKGFNELSEEKKSQYNAPGMKLNDRVQAYAREREKEFFEELDVLNVRRPDSLLRVTEVIPEIVKFIQDIIDEDFAYVGKDNSVYFDVEKYESDPRFVYAELERSSFNAGGTGAEFSSESEGKRNRNDFALWKAAKSDEPYWPSPWGNGRPGWHIECSTMSSLFYGDQFDIHCGGIDLRFPHHTNEIAQSQARSGIVPWVKMWLHTGQLRAGGQKNVKVHR
jgi:cysteinyl-tRNA synthetase